MLGTVEVAITLVFSVSFDVTGGETINRNYSNHVSVWMSEMGERGLLRLLACICCASLFLFLLTGKQAAAQSGVLDVDPPVIDHEALETGKAGDMQTFTVRVSDDRDVLQVVLFYRSDTSSEYANVVMREVANLGKYSAVVVTKSNQSKIEYYIEARDTGGNRVLKGFPYYPLVRPLEKPEVVLANPVNTSAPSASASSGGVNVLYVLLGVVALGALIAGSDSEPPATELVPLNIGITPP